MSGGEPERHVLQGFPDTAARFVRAMEQNQRRVAAERGISDFDLRAIFRIAAAGSITPKQLATDLSVTKGAITGLSTRLVDAGLVARVEHPLDRRSLHLELTPAGHDAMREMHDDFRARLSAAGTLLGDEELSAAASVLQALTRRLTDQGDDLP